MRILGSALAATLLAGSAHAATTVLTFDRGETACSATDGGATNQVCSANGQFIGGDYGSTAELTVSYDSSDGGNSSFTSLRHTIDRFYTGTDGQATVAGYGPETELAKIIFTPLAGYEVSFRRFAFDKLSSTSAADFIFEVRDAANNLLWDGGFNGARSHTVNTAYFTGPVTFLFGNGGRGFIAVDDVTVDVRATGQAAVPEPSQWALLIAGFAISGAALRKARSRPHAA